VALRYLALADRAARQRGAAHELQANADCAGALGLAPAVAVAVVIRPASLLT
jgi:hypothetical protein